MARLSFGSARAVELRLTSLVFLTNRCHRILGIRRICQVLLVVLLDFFNLVTDPYPDIGLRLSLCAP